MQDKAHSRNKQSISTLEKPLIIDKPFVQLNSDVRLLLLMWHVFYHVLAGLSILCLISPESAQVKVTLLRKSS